MSVYNFAETIVAGSSAQGGSVTQQSLKFNDDESQYLSRTPASAGNRKTFTFSAWIKVNPAATNYPPIFSADNTAPDFVIRLSNTGSLQVVVENGGGGDSLVFTNRLFRDPSSWYHFVITIDTTNATANDRIKVYVNGVEETSFSSRTNPSLNFDTKVNSTVLHRLGLQRYGSYWDGYMTEVNFIDGQALDASSFGQFTNGYWEKIDYAGTYGTNGFHLTFQDDVVSEGFNAVTYRGTGASQSVSGLGLAADLVWIKQRSGAAFHNVFDSLRVVGGDHKRLYTNSTVAEESSTYSGTTNLTSLDGDGFSLGTGTDTNNSGSTYVAWAWKAGGTPTATNTAGVGAVPTTGSVLIDGVASTSALAGTIAANKITANTEAGFSIINYTGNGLSGQTVAHALSSTPDFLIMKDRGTNSNNGQWQAWHKYAGDGDDYGYLSTTAAFTGDAQIIPNGTDTIELKANLTTTNQSGHSFIMYAFHSVAGYSSIGSYSGSGATGNAVTTGFAPAFVMLKRTDSTSDWTLFDNTRDPYYDGTNNRLWANLSNAESTTANYIEFTSTGFTLKAGDGVINASGGSYIYMAFADTREAAFWKDVSGQGNHWTPNNLDYRDSVIDSPANNFATLNPLAKGSGTITFSEGNLKSSFSASLAAGEHAATFTIPTSGKWYWEAYYTGATTNGSQAPLMGIMDTGTQTVGLSGNHLSTTTGDYVTYYSHNNAIYINNALTNYTSHITTQTSAIVGFALDMDNGHLWVSVNGTYINGTPNFSTGGNKVASPDTSKIFLPFFSGNGGATFTWTGNFGQDSTFAGSTTAGGNTDDNGIGDFKYAPPTGYLALCTANLPTPTIVDGSEHFNTVAYTGTGTTNAITVGFAPDFVWGKQRSGVNSHELYDTVRGVNQVIYSDLTDAEGTNANGISSFDADGYTVAGNTSINLTSASVVAWNWKAGGTAVSNTDGSITSQVSANTTAGFSIVSFTCGSGVTSGTVGHGLGVQPQLIIGKTRNHAVNWYVQTPLLATNLSGILDTTSAWYDPGYNHWNDTHPTNTVFSVGGYMAGHADLTSPSTKICYCFANVDGYSKVGSYVANGSADGPFVYTGFRPAWVMIKRTDASADWWILDNKRNSSNVVDLRLRPNSSSAEEGPDATFDFVANGLKIRGNYSTLNASGGTYIYLAFAESPFKYSNAR